MRPRIFAILLSAMLLWANVIAIDYTIKEVIEIGEADFVPFLSPVIWSPDGTKLAFTKDGVIKISDTLGNVSDVLKPEMPIHRWGWVSDSLIAVHMRRFTGNGPETQEELSLIDVSINTKSVIHSFAIERNYREIPGKTIWHGPYKTIEGHNYYITTIFESNTKNSEVTERLSFVGNKDNSLVNDHILRWNGDYLFKVRLDNTDSTWLAKRPASVLEVSGQTLINRDQSHILIRDGIINLKDSSFEDFAKFFKPFPPKTSGCGLVWYAFNPKAIEILFTIACDDGHSNELLRIGTFDYFTKDFEIIDTLINIPNCVAPSYSPNGNKIAFLANGKTYILDREVK